MKIKKVESLFFTVENTHADFCKSFENFNFCIKDCLNETDKEFQSEYQVIFVDFSFLCAFRMECLLKIKSQYPRAPIFVISEEDSACFAVQCIKYGAEDYFVLPTSPEIILEKIKSCCNVNFEKSILSNEEVDLIPEFIGKSPEILNLKNQVRKYAATNLPILLIGESGTGKSFLAKLIHKYSKKSENPFCEENMATIQESIAEAVLFGTKRWAYTGAENHIGLIETAKNGTLFLDEISESSLGVQAKLLRLISEKSYRPLGENEDKKTDLRLITATNANLQKAIENKTFREDLFYRINPLTIKIPPLRERKDDIPLLIEYFVNKKKKDITFGAIELLKNHAWKGNVRELESTLERAICLCSNNTITREDLIFY